MEWSETVSVAVFVLRKRGSQTEVLLLPDPRGGPGPVIADLAAEESELRSVLRGLGEATGLDPRGLYGTSVLLHNEDRSRGPVGRVGVFVATVEAEAETGAEGASWRPLVEGATALPRPGFGVALREVFEGFVRRSADEALRIL